MKFEFAARMGKVPRSFVREILKVTEDPEIISFAGGLPSPESFPYQDIKEVAVQVLEESGAQALQYSTTEGYYPLREWVSHRYQTRGIKVDPEEVLITNGSQQGLDLVGKIFLNQKDGVLVERPTYLAALQSFGLYEPEFHSLPLEEDGVNVNSLEEGLDEFDPKLFYAVPNFQNPTGITYSLNRRKEVAQVLMDSDTIFVEDNPYGEIRFMGEDHPPVKAFLDESILLGSFSKIVSPGIRLGWITAPAEVMDKLVTAKQASDLHSSLLSQMIVQRYLSDYDVEAHLKKIRRMYKSQRDLMVSLIREEFPEDVQYTEPEGGMFLWVTLPEGISSLELFEMALKEKVAFVPGQAFYAEDPEYNTLRMNFSNSSEERIEEGIKRLGKAIKRLASD
jgi:2-aminoadipate transaminase